MRIEPRPGLVLKIVGHKHAEYACKKWHYSRRVPAGKKLVIGVWEHDTFRGVVIFSRGASSNIGKPFGLSQAECVELTRVALDGHAFPLTLIIKHALRILKRTSPGLRRVVSYADPEEGHHGGLYQAANWVFVGRMNSERYFIIHGKKVHPKRLHSLGLQQTLADARKHLDVNAAEVRVMPKLKYVMPLDRRMRRAIEKLRKPYPKPDLKPYADGRHVRGSVR